MNKTGSIEKSAMGTIPEEDLTSINRFTRHPLKSEEVYTFSVILCDNEVDRDCERFTTGALEELAGLFIGKTGIFDHNPSGRNQTARIYGTGVVREPERRTRAGEEYACLRAKAYMLRSESNAELIAEIEGGIKKEVSVSCSVSRTSCSICGQDLRAGSCSHQKGQTYGGKLCHHVLAEPTDAYEWSFVAIPAQIAAGVTKQFGGVERTADLILKQLGEGGDLVLSAGEAGALHRRMEELRHSAELGEAYRHDLQQEVRRLAFLAESGLDAAVVKSVTDKMGIEELKAFRRAYQSRLESSEERESFSHPSPQLRSTAPAGNAPAKQHSVPVEFKI